MVSMSAQTIIANKHAGDDCVKRSLVLSGGGMRLSYQAGAMQALAEAEIVFQHIDATSGGSMNLSMLLSGLTPLQMCQQWTSLKMKDSLSLLPIGDYLRAGELKGMGDADGIRHKVFPHLGIDAEKIRNVNSIYGTYNVLDYANKQVKVIPHTEIDTDMMIAGISLPGVFPPIMVDGKSYLDTAFIQDANLMEAVRQGADEIWLIWGLGNTANYQGGPLNIYIQMLETSANGALNNEIAQIKKINERILQGDSEYGQSAPIQIHIIQPKHPLPLDPELYLGNITNQTLIEMGYADARAYLANKSDKGLTLTTNITRMIEPTAGLRFCESQFGQLQFESTKKTDQVLSINTHLNVNCCLNVTVHIHNFENFIDDLNSHQPITGNIFIENFVDNQMLSDGYFYISADEKNKKMKVIRYSLNFIVNNEKYTLNAKKEIFDDPGFDKISDISTVFCELYREKNNQKIAAGSLRLSLSEIAKQAASIRTTHCNSPLNSTKIIAQFAALMLTEHQLDRETT